MSEEKKLNDEALEKVTGGVDYDKDFNYAEKTFIAVNCILPCRHEGLMTCPYGTDKKAAITKAMSEGGEICLKRELPKV